MEKYFFISLLLSRWILGGDSLLCYQCADSVAGGPCQTDMDGMIQDFAYFNGSLQQTTDISTPYKFSYRKDCSAVENATACIIERIEQKGEKHAFIRDCTDRYTFSLEDTRLTTLPSNNDTTCMYTKDNFLYCVTICVRDFCNGPQFDSNNANRGSSLIALITAFIINLIFYSIKHMIS